MAAPFRFPRGLTTSLDRSKVAFVTLKCSNEKLVYIAYSFLDKRTIRYGGAVYTYDAKPAPASSPPLEPIVDAYSSASATSTPPACFSSSSSPPTPAHSHSHSDSSVTRPDGNRLRETAYQRCRVRPRVFYLMDGLNMHDPFVVAALFSKVVGVNSCAPIIRGRARIDAEERKQLKENRRVLRAQAYERRIATLLKPTVGHCSAKRAQKRAEQATATVASADISVLVD